jgi:hypothetical protein
MAMRDDKALVPDEQSAAAQRLVDERAISLRQGGLEFQTIVVEPGRVQVSYQMVGPAPARSVTTANVVVLLTHEPELRRDTEQYAAAVRRWLQRYLTTVAGTE